MGKIKDDLIEAFRDYRYGNIESFIKKITDRAKRLPYSWQKDLFDAELDEILKEQPGI